MEPSGGATTRRWVDAVAHSVGSSRCWRGRIDRPGLSSSHVRSAVIAPQSRMLTLMSPLATADLHVESGFPRWGPWPPGGVTVNTGDHHGSGSPPDPRRIPARRGPRRPGGTLR